MPADPPDVVRTTVEAELGQPLAALFREFDETPLASASIGQVHRARLPDGEDVVVKVQHRGIDKTMRIDLDILTGLAQLAERVPEFKNYRPIATVAELRRTLLRELDFVRERRNLERFKKAFRRDRSVLVPHAYGELSTARVLTMERIDGVALADGCRLREAKFDLDQVARRGADIFLEMIFTHGFYHADPHPGNFLLLDGNVIGLLDFGMVGEIDEPLREYIEELLLALANRDGAHLTSVVTRISAAPGDLDVAALGLDLADFLAHYAGQPLNEFDLGAAINEMTEIIRRYHLMLPARMGMLLKVLVMLEGTARLASPRFSLMELVQPYQRKMLLRRLSPTRQIRKLRRMYLELEHLVEMLPRGLSDILQQVQSGKFDVHLDHRGLEPSVNRLVLGLLSSSLFVGSAMLLRGDVGPIVHGIPLPGALGLLLSFGLGLRLLWAVRKSGNLDRKNPANRTER